MRHKVAVIAVALVAMLATAALGRWQLRRAAQKEARQAMLVQRQRLPALDGAALARGLSAPELAALQQRSVKLAGYWLPAHTIYLDNRTMDHESGFYVVTPLRLAQHEADVLVVRGWAARDATDRARLPLVQAPAGLVQIDGRVTDHVPTTYALGPDAATQIRQNLALDAFRTETGLPLAPVVVEQVGPPSDGLLRHWPAPDSGVARHYGYAAQWFGMSGLVALLFFWFQIVKPLRARRHPSHG